MPADVQRTTRSSSRRAARSRSAGTTAGCPSWEDPRTTARARRAALSRPPAATEWTSANREQPAAAQSGDADVVEEFARAMADYRKQSGRMFPTWCEVLEVLQSLGYRRVPGADGSSDPAPGEPGQGSSPE